MAVFYLKYAKADVASELVKQFVSGGGSSSSSDSGGSLLGTIAGAALGGGDGGGIIGSLLGGGASATLSGGTAIIADGAAQRAGRARDTQRTRLHRTAARGHRQIGKSRACRNITKASDDSLGEFGCSGDCRRCTQRLCQQTLWPEWVLRSNQVRKSLFVPWQGRRTQAATSRTR